MKIRVCLLVSLALVGYSTAAFAQNWSFDARSIGLGGGGGNLASNMIDEQRNYKSIVLPFGFIQVFKDLDVFKPDSKRFDIVRSLEYAASPFHYVINRASENSSEALLI